MSQLSPENSNNLNSLLRVMDVASELRKERENAEKQLSIEEEKSRIAQKIRKTAEITGEELKDEEIRTAIDSYFSGLYRFTPPQKGFSYFLARAFVARTVFSKKVVLPIVAVISGVFGFNAYEDYSEAKELKAQNEILVSLPLKARKSLKLFETLARQGTTAEIARRLETEVSLSCSMGEVEICTNKELELEELLASLRQEYEIHIVSSEGEKSGIDRYYTDKDGTRISGNYLILEARDKKGQPVPLSIRNSETGTVERVSKWAERVPENVYSKVRKDKQNNGIVDDSLFAIKERGFLEVQVKMLNSSAVLKREAQVTRW